MTNIPKGIFTSPSNNNDPTPSGHHENFLDSNIVNNDKYQSYGLVKAHPPRRHSVVPDAVRNNLMNDSQSNISDSSVGSKGSKLGRLFQNINKKIR